MSKALSLKSNKLSIQTIDDRFLHLCPQLHSITPVSWFCVCSASIQKFAYYKHCFGPFFHSSPDSPTTVMFKLYKGGADRQHIEAWTIENVFNSPDFHHSQVNAYRINFNQLNSTWTRTKYTKMEVDIWYICKYMWVVLLVIDSMPILRELTLHSI